MRINTESSPQLTTRNNATAHQRRRSLRAWRFSALSTLSVATALVQLACNVPLEPIEPLVDPPSEVVTGAGGSDEAATAGSGGEDSFFDASGGGTPAPPRRSLRLGR